MARHPFTYRDFRFYWTARLALTLAQNAMVVIIGWQVYDIARRSGRSVEASALQLGFIGAVQFLPLLLLTLVVGWVADHMDRRWIVRGAVTLELGCAVVLALLTYAGTMTLPALFLVAGLLGVARAFAGPAMGALAPNLVPKAVLPTAIALSAIAWQSGAVVGPALGGYLYASSHGLPYAVSAVLFAVSCACLFLVRPIPRTIVDQTASRWRQMVDGLHYVARNRVVLGAISLDLFAVLLGGATAMLPIFARDILQVGSPGLGHLRAAPAVGSAAVAILFAVRPLKHKVGLKMFIAVGTFGLATIVFGLSRALMWPIFGPASIGRPFAPAVLLSLACLAILGAADMVSVYVRQSLIQIWTPNAMRGRVGAVSTLFISGSNELGEAESGFIAAMLGPVGGVIFGGLGAITVTILWARWFPELRTALTFDPPTGLDAAPAEEMAA